MLQVTASSPHPTIRVALLDSLLTLKRTSPSFGLPFTRAFEKRLAVRIYVEPQRSFSRNAPIDGFIQISYPYTPILLLYVPQHPIATALRSSGGTAAAAANWPLQRTCQL